MCSDGVVHALRSRALRRCDDARGDGADTIATVKEKFDTALLESDQEPMKGLSLWHENARLDESRTLQSYGVGAGAAIQALATEHDVEVELREEREAEDRARAEAERSFGWKANYGCCVSKAEGERRRREAMEQARQLSRDLAQLGPAQLKAKYDTAANRKALYYAAAGGKTKDVRRYIRMGVDVDWQNPDRVRLCSKERSSQRETTSLDTTHTRGRADAVPLPAARALGRKMTSSTIRAAIRTTL